MALSVLIEEVAAISNAKAIAFTSLLLFCFLYLLRRNLRASRLPPGPFAWPIIGNLLQLREFPYRSLQQMANKHGPILYLKLGYFPTVVVSSAEMAKEFLKTHDLAFASRPKTAAGKYLAYNYQDIAFAPSGSYWKLMRKICVNELLSAKRLQSFTSIREEQISEAMWRLWEKSEQGRVGVNVSKIITFLTSTIIWRLLAGKRYCEDDVVGCGGELRDMMKEVAGTILEFNIGDFLPYIDWLDLQGIKRRMKKAHLFFDRVVQKIIDQHVKDNGESMQESRVNDIIDVLLDMAASGAEDITLRILKQSFLYDLFIAGTDTISTTLEWAMSEMLRNPHIAAKLQEEIESVVGKH
ncbi:hypothetical protein SUGI_0423200 [Cryptomeria japonica]|nr:hypothetical protein SUGI_0423200 [Cryptomeria japonica]